MGILFLFSALASARAQSDFLAHQTIQIPGNQPEASLQHVEDNLRSVFERYQPAVDYSLTLVNPVQVGGTLTEPTMKLTLEKCVLIVCKDVNLDAEMSLSQVSGPCDRNLLLVAELGRSSEILTNVYDRFEVQICLKKTQGLLDLTASAHQALSYSTGIVQGQILKVLQMQIGPILTAVQQELGN